jgi:hypothetical protein
MTKSPPHATPVYARQHSETPTLAQQNAIDLLAAGKTDQETAELLELHRTTVTKWRLYDPVFQAALNRRRAEIWGATGDRLRSLLPKALDTLAAILDEPENPSRLKAAVELLRLVPLSDKATDIGLTDADEIVRETVRQRRSDAPGVFDSLLDQDKNLPPIDEHVEQVWRELREKTSVRTDRNLRPNGGPMSPC